MIRRYQRSSSLFRKIMIVTVLLGAFGNLQDVNGQSIRAGASFLKMLPGARQQGLAGSTTALVDEIYSFYANPAATGFLREHQWSLTYTKWITDIYNISFNYGRRIRTPWSNRTGIVLGINYEGIREFDSSRGAAPPASASDVLVSASVGNPISFISENLSLGVNLKYLRSDLDQFSASAFGVDVGTLCRTDRFRLSRGIGGLFEYGIFSFGLSATQLGNSLEFISSKTPLPRTFRAGAAFYTGSHSGLQLQLAADYRDVLDEISTFGFGAELSWRQRISFRGGYNFNDRLLSKYSFGLSLRLDDVQSSLNNFFTGRNNALAFDLVALENNDFFSNAYRASITHIPIGPEKFSFSTKPDLEYTTKDSVQLVWEMTRDPDLYDNEHFGYLVTGDSLELANFVEKAEDLEINIFEGTQNAIAFDFNKTNAGKSGTLSVGLSSLVAGDYYWAIWAYDKDRHVRFASNDHHKIRHFRVIQEEMPEVIADKIPEKIPVVPAPVDTASDLTLTEKVFADPVRLDIYFPFNVDTLGNHSREQLNLLGIALRSGEFEDLYVELGGHTDERGSGAYNQALSQRRVNGAKRFLVNEFGIAENRLSAVGYGESKPIYANAEDDETHAANRRVELKFIEPSSTESQPPNVVLHNQRIGYEIKIKNPDNVVSRNLLITDVLPDALHTSEFSIEPKVDGGTLTWTFDTLEPGDSLVITYQGTAPNSVDSNPYRLTNSSRVLAMNDTSLTNNTDGSTVFVIGSPDTVIYYDNAGPDIGRENVALITWAKYLQVAPYVDVCIECHTDGIGPDQNNLQLSQQKAEAARNLIADWLITNSNAVESKLNINAKGWGEARPVAPNVTDEGKQLNRRIVIHLSPCN